MEDKLAKIISVLCHPLLFPSYFLVFIFNLNNYISYIIPTDAKFMIFSLAFVMTFIFPIIFILILKQKGIIQSLLMESREERVYPFVVTGIFNFSAFYMIRQIQIPEIYYLFFLGSAALILVCLTINFYTKISVHLAGAGGLTGALMGISIKLNIDLVIPIVSVFILSGLIGFARLKLKAHQPFQIYLGFICGIIVMTAFLLI
jgi:hypothetical protein